MPSIASANPCRNTSSLSLTRASSSRRCMTVNDRGSTVKAHTARNACTSEATVSGRRFDPDALRANGPWPRAVNTLTSTPTQSSCSEVVRRELRNALQTRTGIATNATGTCWVRPNTTEVLTTTPVH
ncbi:hypothetical protein ASD62_14390 [Phycicoccus sp. Root563]|nr:hypothetical protein ASD62_14390 [Phycicoccus sp. Root563]